MQKDKNKEGNIFSNCNNKKEEKDTQLLIKDKDKEKHKKDYLLKMLFSNITSNIIILLSIIILLLIHYFYGPSLFSYTLIFEENLQKILSEKWIIFFRITSLLGGAILIISGFFISLCYNSLVTSILFLFSLIFMVYLHDLLKLLYAEPRPFWLNGDLLKGKCRTSYGNPSGHSLGAFYFFLSISYFICKSKKKYIQNYLSKTIVYLINIFIAGVIAFSRLALGVHSIDQVFYGITLGIWIFLVYTNVFKVYDMPFSYYLRFYKEKKYIISFFLVLSILLILPIFFYSIFNVEPDFKKYDSVMSKKCPGTPLYKLYSHECMAQSLVLLLIFGVYFGQHFFWNIIYKDKNNHIDTKQLFDFEECINNWNNNYKKKLGCFDIIKILGLMSLSFLPGMFYIFIPGKNNSLRNIFIFKIGLPVFLIGFLFFGPCFCAFIFFLNNKKDNKDNNSEYYEELQENH